MKTIEDLKNKILKGVEELSILDKIFLIDLNLVKEQVSLSSVVYSNYNINIFLEFFHIDNKTIFALSNKMYDTNDNKIIINPIDNTINFNNEKIELNEDVLINCIYELLYKE